MYIPEFWVGVISTILAEIILAVVITKIHNHKEEEKKWQEEKRR